MPPAARRASPGTATGRLAIATPPPAAVPPARVTGVRVTGVRVTGVQVTAASVTGRLVTGAGAAIRARTGRPPL
jgi:hypothetical protein